VKLVSNPKVADPTFSLPGGNYAQVADETVELACVTFGAAIYYTTDGSDPDPDLSPSALYSGAITLSKNHSTTIRACGFLDTSPPTDPSNIVSATYRRTHTISYDNV
jgi:Chitobiase/beta-hexosaminidase C-terminal domain